MANYFWGTELFKITKILRAVFQMASLHKFVEMLFFVFIIFFKFLFLSGYRRNIENHPRNIMGNHARRMKRASRGRKTQ